MSKYAIRVSALSKEYMIGDADFVRPTLRDVIASKMAAPWSMISGRSRAGERTFKALDNVSFEVEQGDVLGVIGRNGAGKSTLLKVLARITSPTSGRAEIHGRIASLLEVGTGFHPELSGRENIYLNGAILGMTRAEITRKFDEIVDFSGVEKFLETPVKRYSSGMYVRLAFAVAAHLDPEILVVDEVLAVGDAEFQKKCLRRMSGFAQSGRTVLFVSHSLGSIRNLCTQALVMHHGSVMTQGSVEHSISLYEQSLRGKSDFNIPTSVTGELREYVRLTCLRISQDDVEVATVSPREACLIDVEWSAYRSFPRLELKLSLFRDGVHVVSLYDNSVNVVFGEESYVSSFDIPAGVLTCGTYALGVGATVDDGRWLWGAEISYLDVTEDFLGESADRARGLLRVPYKSSREKKASRG